MKNKLPLIICGENCAGDVMESVSIRFLIAAFSENPERTLSVYRFCSSIHSCTFCDDPSSSHLYGSDTTVPKYEDVVVSFSVFGMPDPGSWLHPVREERNSEQSRYIPIFVFMDYLTGDQVDGFMMDFDYPGIMLQTFKRCMKYTINDGGSLRIVQEKCNRHSMENI